MPRGTRLLGWPFRWLSDFETQAYRVAESVQPTLDIGQHGPEIQLYEQQFVMIAGANAVILPGLNRPAALNPAALPNVQSRGARRWTSLTMESDTPVGAVEQRFAYVRGPSSPSPDIANIATAFPANQQRIFVGTLGSILVPDPFLIRFSIEGQVGGEIITLRGIFTEADSLDEPLPKFFL